MTSSSESPAPRAKPGRPPGHKEAVLGDIEKELITLQVIGGAMLTPVLPVTGRVMVSHAPEGASVIVKAAERDPRIYRALVWFYTYSAWAQLATLASTYAVAVAVDSGRFDPDNAVAQRLVGEEIKEARPQLEMRSAARGAESPNGAPAEFEGGPSGWDIPSTVGGT